MNQDEARRIITQTLGPYQGPNRPYPRQLPRELEMWRCYTPDGGHSIQVVLKSALDEGNTALGSMVPAPIKTVERHGWTVTPEGYLLCDLPYNKQLGLIVEPGDDEF